MIVQTYNQIQTLYKEEWQNILGNINYNLYLHLNNTETNEYFSKGLGDKQITILNHSYHNGKQGKNVNKQKTRVISYDELPKIADKDIAILSIRKTEVYEIKLIPFWKNKKLIDYYLEL